MTNQENNFIQYLDEIKFITIASGLSFRVLNASVISDVPRETSQTETPHIAEPKRVKFNLTRYSKREDRQVGAEIVVSETGSFLPNNETNQTDIVKVTVGEGENSFIIQTAAHKSHVSHKKFDLLDNNLVKQHSKIQTRNGLWYMLLGNFVDSETGQVFLNLGLLGSDPRVRNRRYHQDGRDCSERIVDYSPHDIIRIETL